MKRSVRARLTAWNGGVLTFILLGFAAASYGLLSQATIEQTDDALRQQLRTAELTIEAHRAPPTDDSTVLAAVVEDLQERGYRVAIAEGAVNVLVTRAVRGERAVAKLRAATRGDPSRAATVPADLLQEITRPLLRGGAFTVPDARDGQRVRTERAVIGHRRFILAATESLDEVDELLSLVRGTFLVAIPVVVGLALIVGYLLARRALAPIAAMTVQAEQIGARTLHERLAIVNPHDELGRLATAFNAVLSRVDRAMEQQRRFTADASHELRTPIAIIRSEADVALAGESRTIEEHRDALTVIRDGSEQLSRIVNDLFLLARADSGQAAVSRMPLYLDELASDTVRRMRSLATKHGVEIAVDAPDDVPYEGDEELLRRVLVNLLDNAIKHAPRGTTIDVTLRSAADGHRLTVTDAGQGIPEASRPFVFDRFYRADTVRAHETSDYGTGAGLGLAIAREIADLHSGRLTLVEASGGRTTFELFLPRR